MKKLLAVLFISIIFIFTLASCSSSEPEIFVNENGFIVVNGVVTDIVADKEDVISVSDDGYFIVNGVKTNYRVATDNLDEPSEEKVEKFLHISFDDVSVCFQNLATESYESLFDEPFFKSLKSLRDEYGACISLYTYNGALNGVSSKYASEFTANSDWLKIGFHSNQSGLSLANATYEQGLEYWNNFVINVKRVCGTVDCLDRFPRLEYFAGSKQALLGMRDANFGALGFLSADDNRLSYYFDTDVTTYLYDNDYLKDKNNNLLFISTDIRADWFYNFTTNNVYKKPLKNTVLEELKYRNNNPCFKTSFDVIIVFTHEWLVYDGKTVNSKFNSILETCQFAKQNDIAFNFPQNVTYKERENELLFKA